MARARKAPATRGRAKPKDKAKQDAARKEVEEELEAAAAADGVEAPNEDQVGDGVFVYRIDDGEGNVKVGFQMLGDAKITEAPTILGMALNAAKNQLGIA